MILSDAGDDFDADKASYMTETLLNNHIEGLLPMTVEKVDETAFYQYDITSLVGVQALATSYPVTLEQMKKMLFSLLDTADRLDDYLLDTCHLYLAPETIFLTQEGEELLVPYVPAFEKDLKASLVDLARFFLGKIRRDDKDAIVLGYQVIHELEEEHTTPADLKKFLVGDGSASAEDVPPDPAAGDGDFAGVDVDPPGPSFSVGPEGGREKIRKMLPEKSSVQMALLLLPSAGLIYLILHIYAIGYYTNQEIAAGILLLTVALLLVVRIARKWKKKKEDRTSPPLQDERMGQGMERLSPDDGPSETGEFRSLDPSPVSSELDASSCGGAYANLTQAAPNVMFADVDRTISLKGLRPDSTAGVLLPDDAGAHLPRITVEEEEVLVGKMDSASDKLVTLPSPAVSRIHARLFRREGILYISDLNSTNGTRVNGRLLTAFEAVPLPDGAGVEFADLSYHVQLIVDRKE